MARLHRAEEGWLGEQAVDRDVVAQSGGRLVPWIPLVDAHGIDRAYSLDGVGQPIFVQIKTAAFVDSEGHYRWDFRADSLPRHAHFFAVLGTFHAVPHADDVYWCVDGAAIRRLARKEYDRALRTDIYRVIASPVRADRLAPYRCRREELWRRLARPERLSFAPPLRFPTLRIDQGGVYEFATITDIMIGNRKDLLVFRPAFDVHGGDLLVQLVGSSHAVYLQVKGTAVLRRSDLIRFHIRRSTFIVADDFWVAMRFWNRRHGDLHPEYWLVSSRELQVRTAHERDAHYLTVDVRLDPAVDRWAEYRYPARRLVDVLRSALGELRLAA
jgi:hypothetical protein